MASRAPAVAGFSPSAGLAIAALALGVGACTTSAPVSQVQLAGSNWRVAAVNGQPTPATGDYSMRFERSGQIGARFGCNHMGGRYRLSGGMLTVGDLAQTLMGCPEPAGTFEQQGAAVLGQPMRIAESTGGRVTLMNEVGSIALERQP